MSRSTAVRLASPVLWIVAIISALLSVILTFTSASAVIGYPGPIAGPGRPAGPSLGSIPVGNGTSGWAGGFNRGSRICYQLNGKPAGCVRTEDVATGNLDGYAHFILAIGNANPDSNNGPNCVGEPAPTGQITQDPLVGPVVPIKMGGNVLRIIGNATRNGVTQQVTIDLPFNVYRKCNGPTTTTTTTPGETTTTTTTPGETTTTTPAETTTTTPAVSTTTIPGQTTTTPLVINGTTLAPYDPNAVLDPTQKQTVIKNIAGIAAIIAIASAAAAAATTAATAAAAASAASAASAAAGGAAAGAGAGTAAGVEVPHLQPIDDGGEDPMAGEDEGNTQPIDDGGTESESDASAPEAEQPVDDGGTTSEAESGAPSESQPLDDGGSEGVEGGEQVELPAEPGSSESEGGSGATSHQPVDDGGEEDEEEELPDDGGFSGV